MELLSGWCGYVQLDQICHCTAYHVDQQDADAKLSIEAYEATLEVGRMQQMVLHADVDCCCGCANNEVRLDVRVAPRHLRHSVRMRYEYSIW